MINTDFTAKDYLTRFFVDKDEDGQWCAVKTFNGNIEKVVRCATRSLADDARGRMIQRFWGYKLN